MAALMQNEVFQVALWAMVKVAIILGVMLGVVSYLIYAERKICGHIQARTGPNRVGPLGLLQPIADVGKLLFKEEFTPAGANKIIFHIAPILAVFPAIVTFSVAGHSPASIAAAARAADVSINVSSSPYARLDMGAKGIDEVVRASPHYYNTDTEIERLLAVLRSL